MKVSRSLVKIFVSYLLCISVPRKADAGKGRWERGEGGELLNHKFVAKKLCSIEESFKNFKSRSTLKELMHKFMHKMSRINSSRKVFQNAPNSIRAYLDFQIFPGRMPPDPPTEKDFRLI